MLLPPALAPGPLSCSLEAQPQKAYSEPALDRGSGVHLGSDPGQRGSTSRREVRPQCPRRASPCPAHSLPAPSPQLPPHSPRAARPCSPSGQTGTSVILGGGDTDAHPAPLGPQVRPCPWVPTCRWDGGQTAACTALRPRSPGSQARAPGGRGPPPTCCHHPLPSIPPGTLAHLVRLRQPAGPSTDTSGFTLRLHVPVTIAALFLEGRHTTAAFLAKPNCR